jgi:hypothetical protein
MKKTGLFILAVFIALQLFAQTPLDTAINFSVRTTANDSLHLFDILDEGKIVVIEFMSTS